MSLHTQMSESLLSLRGFSSATPRTVAWSTPDGVHLDIDFTAVDSLGCSFREFRLTLEALHGAPLETLKGWAMGLCQRVTYLLEPIVPLEQDAVGQTILMRSSSPSRQAEYAQFYELRLHAAGTLTLQRLRSLPHEPGWQPVDMQLTQEALFKLVTDIAAAVPAKPAI